MALRSEGDTQQCICRRMEEMSTDEARALFEDFVSLWNGRRLSTMYYDGEEINADIPLVTSHLQCVPTGIPAEIRDAYVKSKHK